LLADSGREVALVVVLDTYLPPRHGGYVGEWSHRRTSAAGVLDRDLEREPAQPPPRSGWRLLLHMLRTQDAEAIRLRLLLPLAGVLRYGPRLNDGVFRQHGLWLTRTARLRPYGGRTLVLHTDENPDDMANWDELLTGPHEVLRVAGGHTGILRPPYVAGVVDHIRAAMDSALGSARRRGAAPSSEATA
jgi:thioesterase domain-containing protein